MLFRCDCEYELSFFPPWPTICSGGPPSLDNSSPCVLENNRDVSDEGDTEDEDSDQVDSDGDEETHQQPR